MKCWCWICGIKICEHQIKDTEQSRINFKFVLSAIEEMHNILCPAHIGTWQEKVKFLLSEIKKLGGAK